MRAIREQFQIEFISSEVTVIVAAHQITISFVMIEI